MSVKTAVIIGVGPDRGLGARMCYRFARAGLHVVVAGRTQAKVDIVAANIRDFGGDASAVRADVTKETEVAALIDQAEQTGPIELAIFNAGNNMPGEFLTMEPDYFETCWRIACYGGFLFTREVLRRMVPRGVGTLLMTGASASMRGKPNFAAFTAAKAGVRALGQSLAREFGPLGIHVAQVIIDGAIDGDRINIGRPQVAAALGPDGLIELEGIVDAYEFLYRQQPRAWSHELDVRTFKEGF
jgi:NAD(P)-dependent dehydrogenase (short-subunit alcohol dehydrogenase family)